MKLKIGNWQLAIVSVLAALLFTGCSTPPPPPSPEQEELSRVTTTARMAYEQGSASQAARLYVRALAMARVQDDPVEIGNNAYNLAACLIAIEKYDDARSLLREAKREFERAKRPVTMILLLDAKAARLQGNAEEALALADQVLASLKPDDRGTYPLQVALLRTQIACDRGDVAVSKAEFAKAGKALSDTRDPVLKADASGIAGRIALLENDPARAAREYDQQADYYKSAGRYRDMALSLGSAGQAYLDANTLVPSADRFYRSARSLYAQGDELAALKMVEAALAAGEKAGDQDSLMRTKALFDEIKKQVEGEKSSGLNETKP
jgi:tetratricopeptide (TPR) repeat protein